MKFYDASCSGPEYPVGHNRRTIYKVELERPFWMAPYSCSVISKTRFSWPNGRDAAGFIDASPYEESCVELWTDDPQHEQVPLRTSVFSSVLSIETGMVFVISNTSPNRLRKVVAICGKDLMILDQELKAALRDQFGLMQYHLNFKYLYSNAVSYIRSRYFRDAPNVYATTRIKVPPYSVPKGLQGNG